ncbi:protein-L-isoaspartate O-methyltransferase [Candidatus Bathyarchaeota archaeon RBG_16_57_9]|nr:MAG: protein-L-isoaspartate O-methyltransferase [Candidatus Bathyarchaeota archaeon RBG_16_57_9]
MTQVLLSNKNVRVLILVVLAIVVISYYRADLGVDTKFDDARAEMVRYLAEEKGINDTRVLEVMGEVPRHLFICPWLIDANIAEQNPVIDYQLPHDLLEKEAYSDHGLPIAEGQSISSPYVVALMTQALRLNGTERVLEIGSGSGYQAAVLAELSEEVYTVEIREILAVGAGKRLRILGYSNVEVKHDDGYFGWSEHAPYDAIIITCAVNHVPVYLLQQLKDGGRMVLPLGSTEYYQIITLIEKRGDEVLVNYITKANFVPMVGEATKSGG